MWRFAIVPVCALCLACGGEATVQGQDSGDGSWEAFEPSGAEGSDTDKGAATDTDKGEVTDTDKESFAECEATVEAGASCSGGWEDTLCIDAQGELWWCEDGVWVSDK